MVHLGSRLNTRLSGGKYAHCHASFVFKFFCTQTLLIRPGQVDSLSGKEAMSTTVSNLCAVRWDLDEFLSFFPAEVVETEKAKFRAENEFRPGRSLGLF